MVLKEYNYCNEYKDKINELAHKIYRKAVHRESFIGKQCCDFKLMEELHDLYLPGGSEALQESAVAKESSED